MAKDSAAYQEFARDLRRAMSEVRKIVKQAARLVAEEVKTEMIQLVPTRTGWLASTIRVTGAKGGGAAVVVGDANTPYTGTVEFGNQYQPGQPFFRPAVERGKKKWEALSERMLDTVLNNLAG